MQRFKFVAFTFVCVAFVTVLQAQGTSNGAKTEVERAHDLFIKEKYSAAQFMYDRMAQSDPQNADAAYYGAVCSERLDNDDARYRLEEFLRLHPQSSRCNMARFYLGNYFYSRSEYAEALDYYKQVTAMDVEYGHRGEYEFKKAYCHLSQGERSKAKEIFSRIQGTKSKYGTSALYYYAHIQYMDGEYELALKNFEKLKNDKKFGSIVPNYTARIYYYLGREDDLLEIAPSLLAREDAFKRDEIAQMVAEVYFNRADYRNALNYYHKVEQFVPSKRTRRNEAGVICTPQDNHYQMGYSYYMLHQYDSAARHLELKTVCTDSVAQNALYVLGDCYVKLGDKQKARSSFLQASQMKFDKAIKEDALFNYAKLSCELNMNPYNESIRSFQDYLKQYPNTKHKTEIQEILASLFMSTRNYKDALTLIEKIPDRNAALNEAYQRIALNRGIELFNSGSMDQASSYFEKAMKINAVKEVTSDACYLYGEAQYRIGNTSNADRAIDRFLLSTPAKKSSYYPQALYTYGYICMKQKRYDDALGYFNDFCGQRSKVTPQQLGDVHNRMGDCAYVSTHYSEAIGYYDRVINADVNGADYATYQKALCQGAMGKREEKLATLNTIFERYKESSYSPRATLEIANTYTVLNNNEMALVYYNKFIKDYPNNSKVKDALLNMGLVHYNLGQNDKALVAFDKLLKKYPGTEESRDALATIKNIYVEQNRVDEYFSYVQRVAKISVSTSEQDSTTFVAAQNRYFEGDCESSIIGFENYVNKFPNGQYSLTAHYYLADCLHRTGQNERALPHYEYVIGVNTNQYTETSLVNAAQIAYSLTDYTKALLHYTALSQTAETPELRTTGTVGMMRCYAHLGSHDDLITTATSLTDNSSVTDELRDEAYISMARSYKSTGDEANATRCYNRLLKSTNGEYSGEAAYYGAENYFNKKQYDEAESAIERIIAEPHSDYWLAKTFILWADIFYVRENNLQAKQTLQSIIDNYDGEDLVRLAQSKYDAIVASESIAQPQEEQPIEIELGDEF
ncbi:MAG: tetratricopeptide repeat protein [Bacteroidales bacterium]|nr:tetratricopeptide repeat protein [Bacteroidales bacterium]